MFNISELLLRLNTQVPLFSCSFPCFIPILNLFHSSVHQMIIFSCHDCLSPADSGWKSLLVAAQPILHTKEW